MLKSTGRETLLRSSFQMTPAAFDRTSQEIYSMSTFYYRIISTTILLLHLKKWQKFIALMTIVQFPKSLTALEISACLQLQPG